MRAELLERGWLVLPHVVSLDEVATLRSTADRLVAAPEDPVVQLPGIHRLAREVAAWVLGPALGAVARELLAARRVRLLQDALIVKPAEREGEVPWHRDASYLGYLPAEAVVSVRLALGVEDLDRGGLEVLEGSHRWADPVASRHGSATVEDELAALPAARRTEVSPARREVVLQPGDLSVHLPRTWHRSAPNQSRDVRRTLVTHLFDADATVDVERIEPGHRHHFPRDATGRLVGRSFPALR